MGSAFQRFVDEASLLLGRDELLRTIASRFPHLPAPDALQNSYFKLPSGRSFDPDLIDYLRVLLRCGRTRESYSLLQAICFIHCGAHVPIEIGRRLAIQLGMGIERPFTPPGAAPAWIRRYASELVEPHIESVLAGLEINQGRFLIHSSCGSCDHQTVLDANSDIHQEGSFVCPRCLARLALPRTQLLARMKRMISKHLDSLAPEANGALSEPDVQDILQLAKLFRPFLLLRFGTFFPYIGHALTQPLEYLRLRESETFPVFDIVSVPEKAYRINTAVALFVSRIFDHVSIAGEQISRRLPESDEHNLYQKLEYPVPPWRCCSDNLHEKPVPGLGLTAEETARGEAMLRKMGIPAGARIACLHVRTGDYHKDAADGVRNSDINTFGPAIQFLVDRGFHVVRLGATPGVVPVPLAEHPRVVDYANGWRTEFLDLYLSETCEFMIGTGSGIDSVRMSTTQKTLFLNLADFGRLYSTTASTRSGMKKIWSNRLRRYLDPVVEHLLFMESSEAISELDCRFEDLTPEELLACTAEYVEHVIDGKPYSREELELEQLVYDLTAQVYPLFAWNARHHCLNLLREHAAILRGYAKDPESPRRLALMHLPRS